MGYVTQFILAVGPFLALEITHISDSPESNMKTIRYPSKHFKLEAKKLLGDQAKFAVMVAHSNPKKKLILAKLAHVFLGKRESTGKLKQAVDTFRVTDFLSVFSGPLLGRGYVVSFKDEGDLVVTFEPIIPKKE